jgi:hypothetical protein
VLQLTRLGVQRGGFLKNPFAKIGGDRPGFGQGDCPLRCVRGLAQLALLL